MYPRVDDSKRKFFTYHPAPTQCRLQSHLVGTPAGAFRPGERRRHSNALVEPAIVARRFAHRVCPDHKTSVVDAVSAAVTEFKGLFEHIVTTQAARSTRQRGCTFYFFWDETTKNIVNHVCPNTNMVRILSMTFASHSARFADFQNPSFYEETPFCRNARSQKATAPWVRFFAVAIAAQPYHPSSRDNGRIQSHARN